MLVLVLVGVVARARSLAALPPATWRNGGTSLANDLTNVGKAMSETTHLEMVYTTYLW